MPTAAIVQIKRNPSARVPLARPGAEPKAMTLRARSRADAAARRRELATLLRSIKTLMRQAP